jgi:tetratricopeptide (TPR) repeat protein
VLYVRPFAVDMYVCVWRAPCAQAFEAALALDPTNSSLAAKVGRSLVATHDFGPAIEYYEAAIARDKARGVENNEMRSDLTMLYVKLRKFAEVCVVVGLWCRRVVFVCLCGCRPLEILSPPPSLVPQRPQLPISLAPHSCITSRVPSCSAHAHPPFGGFPYPVAPWHPGTLHLFAPQASRLLDDALKSADSSDDVTSMIQARNNLTLLGSVRKGTGNPAEGIEALLRALELQNKIIVKLRSLNPGACLLPAPTLSSPCPSSPSPSSCRRVP